MATSPTCACTCETSDSALSITANIIYNIALAYVLLVGLGYRLAIYQTETIQKSGLHSRVNALQAQVASIKKRAGILIHFLPGL